MLTRLWLHQWVRTRHRISLSLSMICETSRFSSTPTKLSKKNFRLAKKAWMTFCLKDKFRVSIQLFLFHNSNDTLNLSSQRRNLSLRLTTLENILTSSKRKILRALTPTLQLKMKTSLVSRISRTKVKRKLRRAVIQLKEWTNNLRSLTWI